MGTGGTTHVIFAHLHQIILCETLVTISNGSTFCPYTSSLFLFVVIEAGVEEEALEVVLDGATLEVVLDEEALGVVTVGEVGEGDAAGVDDRETQCPLLRS